jgi:hypothetical protein
MEGLGSSPVGHAPVRVRGGPVRVRTLVLAPRFSGWQEANLPSGLYIECTWFEPVEWVNS